MISEYQTLNEIQSLIEEGKLSFLIGAGFGKNISNSFPLWKELLSDAIWDMYGTGKDSDRKRKEQRLLDKVLKNHTLLEIASKVVSDAGFHEAIDSYIETHTPYLISSDDGPQLLKNGSVVAGKLNFDCHNLLRQLEIPNIYTFNYDNALEFYLGNKKELQRNLTHLKNELEKARKELKSVEDSIGSYKEKKAAAESLHVSSGVVEIINGQTDSEKNLEELYQKDSLRYQELKAIIEDKRNKINAVEGNLDRSYLVVNKSSDIALTANGHNIYKIHGDLRTNSSDEYGFDGDNHTQYIITQEDYDTYESKHAAFVNLMRIDLLRNRFCVIGVSGGDANFLAWINWVKDVLDKTGNGDAKENMSFFIHAGNSDLSSSMKQMLKNHFICPVILKDFFPDAKDDTERVKCFLQYIRPNNNLQSDRLTKLWRNIDRRSLDADDSKVSMSNEELDELCDLSSKIVFHRSMSTVHYSAKEVLLSVYRWSKDTSKLQKLKVFSAAIRCSLLPLTGLFSSNDLILFKKTKNDFVRESLTYAHRRMLLLSQPNKLSQKVIGDDVYSDILRRLFLFDFPSIEECVFKCDNGLDYIRRYSLQVLLIGKSSVKLDESIRKFNSPQELVLVGDWLKWLDRTSDTKIVSLSKQYIRKYAAFHLSDYFESYLREMRERSDISTYGNVQEIIYMDERRSGFENASVFLNSIVELGITFAGHTVLKDEDWVDIVCNLKSHYPYPVVFYTIVRKSKSTVIKRIAQELMYDDNAYKFLPDILKRIMIALTAKNTPGILIEPMAVFAEELLIAVPVTKWGTVFKSIAEPCLEYADNSADYNTTKFLYSFVSAGVEHLSDKELKKNLLKRVVSNLSDDNILGGYLNSLAISARKGLTISDFSAFAEELVSKTENGVSQINAYVLINLAGLLSDNYLNRVYDALEKHALKDSNMVEAYAYLIRKNKKVAEEFKDKLSSRDDVWRTGAGKRTVSLGDKTIKISRVDKTLGFKDIQIQSIYKDLKKTLSKINQVLDKPNHEAIDMDWMSPENNFREAVMDMMVLVNRHKGVLQDDKDYQSVIDNLHLVYSKCCFGKTIMQMISDDMVYRAIRCMMTQTEIFGINTLETEYELILGKILSRDSKDVNICFQHISWVIKEYEDFFSKQRFNELFTSILDSYAQYFVPNNQRTWDLRGCEKEIAEKYLMKIAQILANHNHSHPFWGMYKKKYYLV